MLPPWIPPFLNYYLRESGYCGACFASGGVANIYCKTWWVPQVSQVVQKTPWSWPWWFLQLGRHSLSDIDDPCWQSFLQLRILNDARAFSGKFGICHRFRICASLEKKERWQTGWGEHRTCWNPNLSGHSGSFRILGLVLAVLEPLYSGEACLVHTLLWFKGGIPVI